MNQSHHIASVVLNYNSAPDVDVLLPQLLVQKGVQHTVIVVDNASTSDDVKKLREVFSHVFPQGQIGTPDEISEELTASGYYASAYLLLNHENRGYSAGNNIGVRLAHALGADAVLITNPDIRISRQDYITSLATSLFADTDYALAASAVRNLSGIDENPMHELSFSDELFWSIRMLLSKLGSRSATMYGLSTQRVRKVSGCCFLARTSFLEQIGFFDEGVFLYCEEEILAAQVRDIGKHIAYRPEIEVVHAHVASSKGDPVKRFAVWSKSRRYYHSRYANYGIVRRELLRLSHACVISLMYIKKVVSDLRGGA